MKKQILRRLALIPAAVLASPVFAAIDTTAAVAGIDDAKTAMLAVIGGMVTLGVAVWGLRKVARMFLR